MQKVLKTGNSLAVVVPAAFSKSLGVKTGDEVKVIAQPEKGRICYQFSGALQLPLAENFLKRNRWKRN